MQRFPLWHLAETGPWTWHGWQDDLTAAVRKSMIDTMQAPPPEDDDVAALEAFLVGLEAPPSPHRDADGGFDAERDGGVPVRDELHDDGDAERRGHRRIRRERALHWIGGRDLQRHLRRGERAGAVPDERLDQHADAAAQQVLRARALGHGIRCRRPIYPSVGRWLF